MQSGGQLVGEPFNKILNLAERPMEQGIGERRFFLQGFFQEVTNVT